MDPITQKIIALTKTPDSATPSDLFDTYAWIGSSSSGSSSGIHTSTSSVDMTEGGMVMAKRGDVSSDWYVADTVTSPLDGSQGTPGQGNVEWTQYPPLTTGGSYQSGSTQSWTVPAGVTSICCLVIGGGAGTDGGGNGGGGGLTWINDVPVTPGTTLTIYHGRSGSREGSWNGQDTHGELSYILGADGLTIIEARGGHKAGYNGISGGGGGTSGYVGSAYQSLTYGGGTGGHGNGSSPNSGKGGGGGAAGYSGRGGHGGTQCNGGDNAPTGSGGGGGGGGHCSTDGGQGGGTGIYGRGADGVGGQPAAYGTPGSGGSGGGTGASSYGNWGETKGAYGGGSGAGSGGAGRGAVRILWGAGRAFPDTDVGLNPPYTHADYGSFNQDDPFHTAMTKGIREWTSKGFEWQGCDSDTRLNEGNQSDRNFAYLFKKHRKFFTIIEYTGNGSTQEIAHDLGCEPSMMWIKNKDDDMTQWQVYHDKLDATNPEAYHLRLSTPDIKTNSVEMWNNTKPTASHFSIGFSGTSGVNTSNKKYIAYLFAADQAVFGPNNNDVVAKTGTYSGTSGVQTINLGWEPQMVIIKNISDGWNWIIMDKMRLMSMTRGSSEGLDGMQYINLPGTQDLTNSFIDFTQDGFQFNNTVSGKNWNASGDEYVYYAIRNDMISEPQSGSEVYATSTGNSGYPCFTSNFPVDAAWVKQTNTNGTDWNVGFRKSGAFDMKWNSAATNEGAYSDFKWHNSIGWNWGTKDQHHQSWMFKRAKGFFDVQYWDGNSTERMINHQLGAVPELAIVKTRNAGSDGWYVYHKDIPSESYLIVQYDYGYGSGANCWTTQAPTATQFPLGTDGAVNSTSRQYVGQFFATIPGVSKVGSYEVNANGDSVSVDCGLSPRFLLIKRYELNGTGGGSGADWLLFDSLRGLATANPSFGNAEWTTPGTYNWTCPAGVTSVCAVCVGGGGFYNIYSNSGSGGSGGGLGWKNNIPVTPGQTYSVVVGKAADSQNHPHNEGGNSSFINESTVMGEGGKGAATNAVGNGGGWVGDGGGNGGKGGIGSTSPRKYGGGGGAGGYSGDGGQGGYDRENGSWSQNAGTDGQGGAGAGSAQGAAGGGVGIYGEGSSGVSIVGQEGGSGGYGSAPNQTSGKFGGGRGSNSPTLNWGGAVRLVWSVDGSTVAFPSTNVQKHETGLDGILELNKAMPAVKDTDYLNKLSNGFSVNTNTILTTPNAKYIYLAIA